MDYPSRLRKALGFKYIPKLLIHSAFKARKYLALAYLAVFLRREKYKCSRSDLTAFSRSELINHAMAIGYKENNYFKKSFVLLPARVILLLGDFNLQKSTIRRILKAMIFQVWQFYNNIFWRVRKVIAYTLISISFSRRKYVRDRISLDQMNKFSLIRHAVENGCFEGYEYFDSNALRRIARKVVWSNPLNFLRVISKFKVFRSLLVHIGNQVDVRSLIYNQSPGNENTQNFDFLFVEKFPVDRTYDMACVEGGCDGSGPVLFSIIVPVYHPKVEYFRNMLNSIANQLCQSFELVLILDGPGHEKFLPILQNSGINGKRLKLIENEFNLGISESTNLGLAIASGNFLVFVDHDDYIELDALQTIHKAIIMNPNVDFLYSDHDQFNVEGIFFGAEYKPDFSPVLSLSYMYLGHLKVIKRNMFELVGLFDKEFDGCQDYDWYLRAVWDLGQVIHIPKILYHYRVHDDSISQNAENQTEIQRLTLKTVAKSLASIGLHPEVVTPEFARYNGLGVAELVWNQDCSDVTIVIPTINSHLVKKCIDSIRHYSEYDNVKILVVDNTSEKYIMEDLSLSAIKNLQIVHVPNKALGIEKGWSYARLINHSLKLVDTEYVLLLNDDVRAEDGFWLRNMRGFMNLPKVGIVGAKLHFPNGKVQTNGIRIGNFRGLASPVFRNLDSWDSGYLNWNFMARETEAVTGACMLIKMDLWNSVNGMDDENFAVAFNDVDFCLRAQAEGYLVVVTPSASLEHNEGSTRNRCDNPNEEISFRRLYSNYVDKFISQRFILDDRNHLLPKDGIAKYGSLNSSSTSTPRILVWSHNLNFEGAPKSLYFLASEMKLLGYEITVVSPKHGDLERMYRDQSIPVNVISNVGSYDETELLSKVGQMTRIIRSFSPDVLLGNTSLALEWILAAKVIDLPTVWVIRESDPVDIQFSSAPNWYLNLWYRAIATVDRAVFVSYSSLDVFRRFLNSGNFAVIHNGINKNSLSVSESDHSETAIGYNPVNFLSIGTFSDRKNQKDTLSAFENAFKENKNLATLTFVGSMDSSYGSFIQKKAETLVRMGYSIELIGTTEEIDKYYNRADVFVTTSLSESFPRTFLEAIQHGLPVIGYPVNGLSEQMRDGWDSITVPVGLVDTLSEQMFLLANQKTLLSDMKLNAVQSFQSFSSLQENALSFHHLIQELFQESSSL